MKFQVEKLDGRHTGHELWRYRLYIVQSLLYRYSDERFLYFHQLRTWMTDQYGPSCERNYYSNMVSAHNAAPDITQFNPPWCWHIDTEKHYLYIYVRDDDTLSNIHLKWTT